jgi:hypothetical protein
MDDEQLGNGEKDDFDDRIFCDECEYFQSKNWHSKCQAGQTYILEIKNRCTIYKQKQLKSIKFWE